MVDIEQILKKNHELREKQELNIIIKKLQEFPYFQKLQEKLSPEDAFMAYDKISKKLKYLKVNAGEILAQLDDKPQFLFFIFQGKVSELKPKQAQELFDEKQKHKYPEYLPLEMKIKMSFNFNGNDVPEIYNAEQEKSMILSQSNTNKSFKKFTKNLLSRVKKSESIIIQNEELQKQQQIEQEEQQTEKVEGEIQFLKNQKINQKQIKQLPKISINHLLSEKVKQYRKQNDQKYTKLEIYMLEKFMEENNLLNQKFREVSYKKEFIDKQCMQRASPLKKNKKNKFLGQIINNLDSKNNSENNVNDIENKNNIIENQQQIKENLQQKSIEIDDQETEQYYLYQNQILTKENFELKKKEIEKDELVQYYNKEWIQCFQNLNFEQVINPQYFFQGVIFRFGLQQIHNSLNLIGNYELQHGTLFQNTFLAIEELQIGVLTKQEYREILEILDNNMVSSKVRALKQSFGKFQTNQGKQVFSKLSQHMVKHYFVKGQFVFKENDQVDGVYFLKKGSYEIMKKVEIYQENQVGKVFNQIESIDKETKQGKFFQKSNNKKKSIFTEVTLSKVDNGYFIGEYEIIENIEQRIFSVKVISSEAKAYYIPKLKFQKDVYDCFELKKALIQRYNVQMEYYGEIYSKLEKAIQKENQIRVKKAQQDFQLIDKKVGLSERVPQKKVFDRKSKIVENTFQKYVGENDNDDDSNLQELIEGMDSKQQFLDFQQNEKNEKQQIKNQIQNTISVKKVNDNKLNAFYKEFYLKKNKEQLKKKNQINKTLQKSNNFNNSNLSQNTGGGQTNRSRKSKSVYSKKSFQNSSINIIDNQDIKQHSKRIGTRKYIQQYYDNNDENQNTTDSFQAGMEQQNREIKGLMATQIPNTRGSVAFNPLFNKVKQQIIENCKTKVKGFYQESLTMRPYSRENMDFLYYQQNHNMTSRRLLTDIEQAQNLNEEFEMISNQQIQIEEAKNKIKEKEQNQYLNNMKKISNNAMKEQNLLLEQQDQIQKQQQKIIQFQKQFENSQYKSFQVLKKPNINLKDKLFVQNQQKLKLSQLQSGDEQNDSYFFKQSFVKKINPQQKVIKKNIKLRSISHQGFKKKIDHSFIQNQDSSKGFTEFQQSSQNNKILQSLDSNSSHNYNSKIIQTSNLASIQVDYHNSYKYKQFPQSNNNTQNIFNNINQQQNLHKSNVTIINHQGKPLKFQNII